MNALGLDYWNDAQEFIRRNSSFCAGLDVAEIDRLTSKALLAAAQLGDEEAAACFVSDAALYARIDDGTKTYPAERDDPEIAALYNGEVLHLAEHGVELGDWRMVVMLSLGFRPGDAHGGNPFGYRIAQPDGAKAFLYASLLSFASDDPLQIQRVKDMPLRADEFGITDDQARHLAAEAQRMYDTYFRNSGSIPAEGSTLCDM